MSEYKNKYEALNAFWDISSLVPSQRPIRAMRKSTSTVDISDGSGADENAENKLSDTVITRTITLQNKLDDKQPTDSYEPSNPLLHRVLLYKECSSYEFYVDFCHEAAEYWDVVGTECDYCDFFSYSPQYDQLTNEQKAYYFWWRECLRNGSYIATNSCYINLLMFELINLEGKITPYDARELMTEVVVNYRDILKGTLPKYIKWICDFSLIHKLSPSKKHSRFLVKNAVTLKEYFVRVPQNDIHGWTQTLLTHCCSYDYKSSKFAKGDALALFDEHVPAAICKVVEYLSKNDRILSGVPFGDCKVTTKAFEGAICSTQNRYTVEVHYCSFSRSHELRFLIGDAVKHCENRIRTHIFVKSKLTVYSLPNDIQAVIDEYFNTYLPKRTRQTVKKQEVQAYDVLYDLPHTELDLSNAARIESESWETTRELVEAFDEVPEPVASVEQAPQQIETPTAFEDEQALSSALGEYLDCVRALADKDTSVLEKTSRKLARPIDAIVDTINQIAVEVIGDIIIDGYDGDYSVIDDYRDMLE